MNPFRLADLYSTDRVVVTAHRGYSGRYPENTLTAFEEAIGIGADILEFDVRASRDGVPVVLHDATLDRTSNGTGRPEDHSLTQLRRFNFSFWEGPHNTGHRRATPAYAEASIPTLADILEFVRDRPVGLNIQIYTRDSEVLKTICALYQKYDLQEKAYLTMSTFAEAQVVRHIAPETGLCILERQSRMDERALDEMAGFGCRFVQPTRRDVTAGFCSACTERNLLANMFFSNEREDARSFIALGLPGILSDCADQIVGLSRSPQ